MAPAARSGARPRGVDYLRTKAAKDPTPNPRRSIVASFVPRDLVDDVHALHHLKGVASEPVHDAHDGGAKAAPYHAVAIPRFRRPSVGATAAPLSWIPRGGAQLGVEVVRASEHHSPFGTMAHNVYLFGDPLDE